MYPALKTINSCQTNGQRPPLSPFCNKLIIQLSKTLVVTVHSGHCSVRTRVHG